MKVKSNKGFTLAELLIVMAIIVVLAAIAIPTFGKQLETARESSDAEAIRAAATNAFSETYTKYASTGTLTQPTAINVTITQKTADFQYVTPTITIGTKKATLSKCELPAENATTIPVTFVFEAESDGQGGITLTSIQCGATASSALNTAA